MTELCDIATRHNTDKAPWCWGYTTTYFDWLKDARETVKTVLEVGVWQGASLRTWRDFFPDAKVYGIDNDAGCMVDEDRIRTFCCDAYNRENMRIITNTIGRIDFFVDDAIHSTPEQTALLSLVWPSIQPGGVYSIEEVREPDNIRTAISGLPGVSRFDIIHSKNGYHLAIMQKAAA